MAENRKIQPVRDISIDDEGDAFQLAMFENGLQVGGAYFPDTGDGSAHSVAVEVGESWLMGKTWVRDNRRLH